MKTVLLVLGCAVGGLVLLVAAVAGIGALLPRRHVVTRSAVYRADPEQIYALIAGAQDWRPDVTRSETVRSPQGQQLLCETGRHGEKMTYEILDCIPERSLTRRIADPNLPYSGSWKFVLTPEAGGTRVRITEDGAVSNPVFRFVSRFILGQSSTMEKYLQALGRATGETVVIRD